MGVRQKFSRRYGQQSVFDLTRRATWRKACAIGDPENMGIDRNGRLAKCHVEYHIRRLAAHAGQGLESRAVAGHHAAVMLKDQPGRGEDVLGFEVVQPDGADVALEAGKAECNHCCRFGCYAK